MTKVSVASILKIPGLENFKPTILRKKYKNILHIANFLIRTITMRDFILCELNKCTNIQNNRPFNIILLLQMAHINSGKKLVNILKNIQDVNS